ncbi:efflux RND transporter periplasmic adaptor subunit [Massilia sp. IC2-278]|uniref:efflux RND transporter periplasmic adaptor subunit n=1 Tax=Massilia sp. IC2-278 TaxID=2887200 RepID=UPI001E649AD6|nr:efflux RND transporter periplasmic adaptor subunit [Massilia sp. IC2-278]MCC2962673.1 efflux RND transporter periplasmic adaptor subunit [Massilia sp. IC2-278]
MPFHLPECRKGLPATGSALLLACLLAACGKDATPPAPAVPEVTVMPVQRSAVRMDVELPGRTSPSLLAEVRARVDGIVQERSFTEGSDVRAGQPLYRIDPAPYRTALASAEAQLKRAQANLASSTAQLKRYKVLIVSNAISKQDFDDAEAAQLQAAADVAAAEAAASNARINLGYTSVTAPIAGRSSISQVTKGAYVQGGSATLMTTIQQLDPMFVDLQQSSVEGLALRRDIAAGKLTASGQQTRVKLQLEDGSTYAHEGTLEVSGVTVDPATGSVTLRARFPNPDHLLLPGMFVRASVNQGMRPNVVQVPAPAVTRNQKGEASVMLVGENGKTVLRPVRTGALANGQWLVEDGLKEGERVIVSGTQKLKPDMAVKVRAAAAAAPAAPAPAAPTPAAAS